MFDRALKFFSKKSQSKDEAKGRLQLILFQDRLEINAHAIRTLKLDLIELLSKYFEIDDSEVEVEFLREKEQVAFVANVPVLNLKRRFDSLQV